MNITALIKPKVFISYSSKDLQFIDKIKTDLRICQIEPLIDKEIIRPGESWQKVLFENSIPTCDVVLAYITDNALKSNYVEREIDVALLGQLRDNRIDFLPYISNAPLRDRLRADLASLHCVEWNNDNYNQVLPLVVSEIWHGYVSRVVNAAVLNEKNKRLEAEIELRNMRDKYNQKVFTESEEKEYEYLQLILSDRIKNPTTNQFYKITYYELLTYLMDKCYHRVSSVELANRLNELMKSKSNSNIIAKQVTSSVPVVKDVINKFVTFGLLKSVITTNNQQSYDFSDKLFRYYHWIGFNIFYNNCS